MSIGAVSRTVVRQGVESAARSFDLPAHVISGRPLFESTPFWLQLAGTPERAQNAQALLARWYPSFPEMREQVRSAIGERFVPLLVDPGIACRIPSFLKFAKSQLQRDPGMTLPALREAFKQRLGHSVVWRGMMIPDEESWKLLNMSMPERQAYVRQRRLLDPPAMVPGLGLSIEEQRDLVAKLFNPADASGVEDKLRVTPPNLIHNHVAFSNVRAGLTSFTRYRPITHVVPRALMPTPRSSLEGTFVQFAVSVPELDLLIQEGPLQPHPRLKGGIIIPMSDHWRDSWHHTFDAGTEVFLLFSSGNATLKEYDRHWHLPRRYFLI